MTSIDTPLFEGRTILLTAVDPEKDAEVEAGWTSDLDYARLLRHTPLRPMLASELKTHYEEQEKETTEKNRLFHFVIRLRDTDQPVGFIRLQNILWENGDSTLTMGIGDPQARGRCEQEALEMILVYAFTELNLFAVRARMPACRTDFIELLEKNGFTRDICQRQMAYQDGQFWDVFEYSLLREEWEHTSTEVKS